jgi:hypothetical protein
VPHEACAILAAIHYPRGFDVDALLLEVCDALRAHGLRPGGVVQRSSADGGGQCATSLHAVDLRSGAAFDIWEDRGACAHDCRLDERGLVDVEATVMAALAGGLDLLVVNRFGRAESLGRGLVACIVAALDAGVPVLTAVRAPYEDAWRAFHGGLARDLPTDAGRATEWATRAALRSPAPSPGTPGPALASEAPGIPSRGRSRRCGGRP